MALPELLGMARRIRKLRRFMETTVLIAVGSCVPFVPFIQAGELLDSDPRLASRPAEEFRPQGMRLDHVLTASMDEPQSSVMNGLSTFTVYPTLAFKEAYTDNVYLAEVGEREDFVHQITPGLVVQSDWDRHALAFRAEADVLRFARTSGENRENYRAGMDVRLDLGEASTVTAMITAKQDHDERDDPEVAPPGVAPARYYQYQSDVSWEYKPDQLGVRVGGSAIRKFYGSNNGIDNGVRSRDQLRVNTRVFYDVHQLVSLFIEPGYVMYDYRRPTDLSGRNRDATAMELLGGFTYAVSDITFVEVGIGTSYMDYDDPSINSSETLAVQAQLMWHPLDILTLRAAVKRNIETTSLTAVDSVIRTRAEAEAIYHTRPDLHLKLRGGYQLLEYEGTTREDEDVAFGAGAAYYLNDHVHIDADYEFRQRDSNQTGASFDENRVILGVNLAM